jgi:DNA-binding transcriptional ArsR family regulator
MRKKWKPPAQLTYEETGEAINEAEQAMQAYREEVAAAHAKAQDKVADIAERITGGSYAYRVSGGRCTLMERFPDMTWEEAAEFFRVLGGPVRLEILRHLSYSSALSVSDLADRLPKGSKPGVRAALEELTRVGWIAEVQVKDAGREKYYQAVPDNKLVLIFNHITFGVRNEDQ